MEELKGAFDIRIQPISLSCSSTRIKRCEVACSFGVMNQRMELRTPTYTHVSIAVSSAWVHQRPLKAQRWRGRCLNRIKSVRNHHSFVPLIVSTPHCQAGGQHEDNAEKWLQPRNSTNRNDINPERNDNSRGEDGSGKRDRLTAVGKTKDDVSVFSQTSWRDDYGEMLQK